MFVSLIATLRLVEFVKAVVRFSGEEELLCSAKRLSGRAAEIIGFRKLQRRIRTRTRGSLGWLGYKRKGQSQKYKKCIARHRVKIITST